MRFELDISWLPDWCPRRHGHRRYTFTGSIFDKIIQLLLHSKVAKAELYLIGGYHNEWLDLTYHIETLHTTLDYESNALPFHYISLERLYKKSRQIAQCSNV